MPDEYVADYGIQVTQDAGQDAADEDAWIRAQDMGRELAPGNPLFALEDGDLGRSTVVKAAAAMGAAAAGAAAADAIDGDTLSCPEPSAEFEPCCWRAGEIMRQRCGDLPERECEERVEEAPGHLLALTAGAAAPGESSSVPTSTPAGTLPVLVTSRANV